MEGLQPLQVAGNQLLGQQRNGGFRRHHERRGFAQQLLGIPGPAPAARRCPVQIFRLEEYCPAAAPASTAPSPQRAGCGTAPPRGGSCTQAKPPAPSSTSATTQVRQWRRSRQRHCTSAMASPAEIAPTPYTPTTRGRDDRGPLHVGIAPRAPREAGEPGAAQQLGQQPQCCKKHSCQRFIGRPSEAKKSLKQAHSRWPETPQSATTAATASGAIGATIGVQ